MINSQLTIEDIEYIERRTKKAIEKFNIENLMDYTLDSYGGCDLIDFYKTIVEETLIEEVTVFGEELSDGKFEITFEFDDKDRWYIDSYAWDTVEIILESLMDNVIIPHMKRGRTSCQNQYIA